MTAMLFEARAGETGRMVATTDDMCCHRLPRTLETGRVKTVIPLKEFGFNKQKAPAEINILDYIDWALQVVHTSKSKVTRITFSGIWPFWKQIVLIDGLQFELAGYSLKLLYSYYFARRNRRPLPIRELQIPLFFKDILALISYWFNNRIVGNRYFEDKSLLSYARQYRSQTFSTCNGSRVISSFNSNIRSRMGGDEEGLND
ncbi:hypothetical protein C8R42DRAFT_640313 [Lentinula raphanica]|nr:hypothetical protein C8R42DRAFT_640313 [Lentinula raphanica]